MKKLSCYLLLVFFLINPELLSAETIKAPDSLLSRINKPQISDKIKAYVDIMEYYSRQMPDEAIIWGEKGIKVAKGNKYLKGEADIYYMLGLCCHLQYKLPKAMKYYQLCFDIRKEIKDKIGIGEVLNRIALLHDVYGNYEKALDFCLQSVSMLEKENNKKALAESINHLGIIYYILNDISKAKELSYKALKILENTDNPLTLAFTHEHLGIIFIKTGENEKALYHTQKALELRLSKDDKVGVAGSYDNLGIIYRNMQKYDKALEYYNKSIDLKKQLNNFRGCANSISGIGITYIKMGQYKKGLDYLFQSYEIRKNLGDKRGIVSSLNKVAETFTTLKDYKNALEYYRLAKVYSDSLLNEQKNKAIAEFQEAYQHERRDKEILQLQKEITNETYLRNLLILISVLAIASAIAIFIAYRSKKKVHQILISHNDEVIKQKEELQRLNDELKKLNEDKDKFFTIIAHDLKSPFTALLGYSEFLAKDIKNLSREEIGTFSEAIFSSSTKLFALLENLLCWARFNTGRMEYNPKHFNLSETIEEILFIYKPNADKKEISISAALETDTKVYADPHMINTVIRNLLSNAIKFSNPGTSVEMSIARKGEIMKFCIEDHGTGIDEDLLNNLFNVRNIKSLKGTAKESGTGLGLFLCKELIEKNYGKIWAESKINSGSRFYFTLPVKHNQLF